MKGVVELIFVVVFDKFDNASAAFVALLVL